MDQVQDIEIRFCTDPDPVRFRVTKAAIRNILLAINGAGDFLVVDDSDGHEHFFAKKEILSIISKDERMGS